LPTLLAEDEKLLREAKLPVEGKGLLDFFRKHTLSEKQRGLLKTHMLRLGDDDFHARQQASTAIVALGPGAAAYLRRALDHPDEEVKERLHLAIAALDKVTRPEHAAAAARLLRVRAPAGAVAVLLAYLPDSDDEIVKDEVLMTLAVLGVTEGKVVAALAEAAKDADPSRRAAAALVLGRFGTAEQRTAARSLLSDPDFAVRFRAAQGLLAVRDKAALAVLASLTRSAPLPLAVRADELLASVAGSHAPKVALGEEPAARAQCGAAWDAWVRRSGASDLTRAVVELPPANPALRAAAFGRQFAEMLRRGDFAPLKNVSEMPFLVGGENVIDATNPNLENQLAQFVQLFREQARSFALSSVRFPGDSLRIRTAAERDFVARFRRGELRPVEILWRAPGRVGEPQGLIILVRIRAESVRVIGVDLLRQ
jgi:HEAT repeat protein